MTQVTTTAAISTTAAQVNATNAEIITNDLNVRTGPGVTYLKIGQVNTGDRVEVTGKNLEAAWLQIVTTNGAKGWISANPEYVHLTANHLDNLPVIQIASAPTATQSAGSSAENQLIFANRNGGDLYIINSDGTGLQKLTSGVIDPVASPDGTQIAFTRWDEGEVGTLYVIDVDGSNERAVLGETLQAKSPTWSPDGQSIIVSYQRGGVRNPSEECRRIDADDGFGLPDNIAQITHTSVDEGVFIICFIRREDLQWQLRRIDVNSGTFEDLPADRYSFSPSWDPAQAWRLLYNVDQGLIQLDIDTGTSTQVTDNPSDKAPVFSPDGQTIALSYEQHDHWEVYTYHLASGERQRLTKPPLLADPQYNSTAPVWSPDGSQLAFLTDRRGVWEIWVMNVDGSGQRPFFPADVQAEWDLAYQGVNERLLSWVGRGSASTVTNSASDSQAASVDADLTGTWNFSFGQMTLIQDGARVEGTYEWFDGTDKGRIEGVVLTSLNQFRGVWISYYNLGHQKLIRWTVAPDWQSLTGKNVDGALGPQWCGVRAGQPLPEGCGFSGSWQLRFGNPSGATGEMTLTQIGSAVEGSYTDSTGQSGAVNGAVTLQTNTEMIVKGTWVNNQGISDLFDWRLDLTTNDTFQGRRTPGNSEWCGWRKGLSQPAPCGWED
ncbi:MAG: SH3 domain-containing protein [Chloroflexota bacterium]